MKSNTAKKLNLGCRKDIREGWINVDKRDFGQDMIYDLNKMLYPLDDNTFDVILAQDIIEHLQEPTKIFREIFRIAKNGATIVARTPHPLSPLMKKDPTHVSSIPPDFFKSTGFEVIYLFVQKYRPFKFLPMRYGNITCVMRVIK
jgi:2-polyprenyl-3-methyl-5-hydroxy-6-metoxy-1,4-benzoquinol methylase